MNYRDWYKKHRHVLRGSNRKAVMALKPVMDTINEREALLYQASRYSENGQVGIIWDGMDCDCASYSYSSVVDASPVTLHRYVYSMLEGAEGPLSYRFVSKTSAHNYKRTSRDLALEAFEEGHSHVVYY